MRNFFLLVTLALAACGTPADDAGDDGPDAADAAVVTGDGGLDVDGGELADADPNQPDSSTGLQQGADCDVFLDECVGGLTCRLVNAQGDGQCRTAGDLPAGAECSVPTPFYAIQPCGEAMICNGSPPDGECQVLCDPANPDARCASSESCSEIVDGVGICH
jgi:hypothetical protein